ncbi:MAG: glycosyltransferase family 1 protein [Candidatus Shapirobacteria bacterium]
MIIGIDGNEANTYSRFGVGQYAFHTLIALYKLDYKNQYHIYLKNPPLPDLPPKRNNWTYHIFGPSRLWTKITLPLHLYFDRVKLDLFYSPGHYSPQFSPFPTMPTIHDLGYLQSPKQFTKKDFYQLKHWTENSLKSASHIVTVSEFSRLELMKIYQIPSTKITLARNGVGKPLPISNNLSDKILSKFKIKKPYFLCLGTLKPNKNIPFLIKAFSESKIADHQLVIAGKKGWLFDDIFEAVLKEKMENKIIFTDFISEKEKWALYQNAICLVIPSLYEGFGIPAIESMKVGTPVIASNIPSLSEVTGNAGLLVDPFDSKSLVSALRQLTNPKIRQKLSAKCLPQAKKFTWVNTARSLISAFTKVTRI